MFEAALDEQERIRRETRRLLDELDYTLIERRNDLEAMQPSSPRPELPPSPSAAEVAALESEAARLEQAAEEAALRLSEAEGAADAPGILAARSDVERLRLEVWAAQAALRKAEVASQERRVAEIELTISDVEPEVAAARARIEQAEREHAEAAGRLRSAQNNLRVQQGRLAKRRERLADHLAVDASR